MSFPSRHPEPREGRRRPCSRCREPTLHMRLNDDHGAVLCPGCVSQAVGPVNTTPAHPCSNCRISMPVARLQRFPGGRLCIGCRTDLQYILEDRLDLRPEEERAKDYAPSPETVAMQRIVFGVAGVFAVCVLVTNLFA